MDSQAMRQADRPAASMESPSLLRDWRAWLAILGSAVAMLTSHAVVKIALLLAALTAVVWLVQSRGLLISRSGAVLGGMALFLAALVVSPYWTIQTLPAGSSAIVLVILLAAAVVWSLCFGRAIARATRDGPDYVVVHEPVWGPQWPTPVNVGGYALSKTFEFGGLRLFAYTTSTGKRRPGATPE